MRVGFDARWYNDSGVGTYVAELLKALIALRGQREAPSNDLELVVYEDPRSAGVLMTTFYTGRDGVPTLAWWMSMLDRLERS